MKRTLVVVESEELLAGQKRGNAVALRKLERFARAGRLLRGDLERRSKKALAREHLSRFVVTTISGNDQKPRFR